MNDAQWLTDCVGAIAAICSIIAIVDCVIDDAFDSSFRLLCGAVAASTVIRLFSECIQRFF